jgi:tRNA-dihydrouridine synthase B
MAGITDQPFRRLCRRYGAGLAASEMVSADPIFRSTNKTRLRTLFGDEDEPRVVQIAGTDPEQLASAARMHVDAGAQIIDINMGCPAKKVCNKLAGSALLRDEALVASILEAVLAAVTVPVTLKMRTGWDLQHRNGPRIAALAEGLGVAALAVHGRTRACRFKGVAEYATIREIKRTVSIPVIANGDITSPEQARQVLRESTADGVMVGRAALGRPWIFNQISYYLQHGELLPPPEIAEQAETIIEHLGTLHAFYGEQLGLRIARKHLHAYLKNVGNGATFWKTINRIEDAQTQIALVRGFFDRQTIGKMAA